MSVAFPGFSQVLQKNRLAPVCVVGNLNVDLIIRNVSEMPKWGQEVIGDEHILVSSGQAGYLAFALRGLEIPTRLIGNVGEDIFGQQIMDDLQACGVDIQGIEISRGYPTGIAVAIVRSDGERAFVTNLGSMTAFSLETAARNWPKTDSAGLVCLVGIFMLSGLGLDGCRKLLGKARAEGKITMLDTGWDPANWPEATRAGIQALLKDVTIFLPNMDEARAITGKDEPEEAAQELLTMGAQLVAIKCGAKGSFASDGIQTCWVPAIPVNVFDCVGAGDNFNAGFIFGLQAGWPLNACMAFGNSTSALYISRRVDRFPHLSEVLETARAAYDFIPCILSYDKLIDLRIRRLMIDFHTHPVMIKELFVSDPQLERNVREIFGFYFPPQPMETFLLEMDAAGVDQAVLLPVDATTAHGCCIVSNEQIASLVDAQPRFIGFASVDPHLPDSAKQLEHAVKVWGLRGLKLDPVLQHLDLNNEQLLTPILHVCASLQIPILIHCGMSWTPSGRASRANPLLLEPAIQSFPTVNFILAHFAWPWVGEALMLAIKYPNVCLDTAILYSGTPQDTYQQVLGQQVGLNVIERSLSGQIVFGTNYPRVDMRRSVRGLRALNLNEATHKAIFDGNARRLLRME